jgi:D-amino-acid dehydrogenase
MKIIVLGAGITGITTAWFLKEHGHDVTVIDRQYGVAQETSKANGCQISVSHAEPWANPAAPLKILKWLGRDDAPLLYHFQNDTKQWRWCLQFLRECFPGRTEKNIRDIVSMCEFSRKTLDDLRVSQNIKYDHLTKGILHFYTQEKEFKDSFKAAELMRTLGCPRVQVDADKVIEIEPALTKMRPKIVGGDFTDNDESGDVYMFTKKLAHLCYLKGVKFLFNTQITRLVKSRYRDGVKSVEIIDRHGNHDEIVADRFVVCMGSYSAELVRPLGMKLMIYPGKGYSATYDLINKEKAPTVSLTDDEHKIVFSRIGNRLRVAGTCELSGFSRDLNMTRCRAITRRAKALFPLACDYDNPTYWTGLRPMTPSNVPYVGKTREHNLFLNTGHGTLGWTMGCGSGRAIADIITHGNSTLDFRFTNENT